jgi:hypothetical protein
VLVQSKGSELPAGLPAPRSAFTGGWKAPAAVDE